MIICQACGARNPPDAIFCASCAAYLAWSGKRVDAPTAPTAPPAVPSAVGAPAAPPASPDPVLPEPARRRPAPPPASDEEEWVSRPDDRICPRCTQRNPGWRHFCQRCGMVLELQQPPPPPAPPPRLSWWRRLLLRLRLRRDGAAPGGPRPSAERSVNPARLASLGRNVVRADAPRPSPRELLRKAVTNPRALLALVALLVLAILLLPLERAIAGGVVTAVHSVKSAVAPSYAPVHPVQASANGSLPGHPASAVIDGLTTTDWASADPAQTGGDPVITLTFDHAVDIAKVGFTSGAAGTPRDFLAHARPHHVHLEFSNGSGMSLTLQDTHTFQALDAAANGVTSVTIDVTSVYDGEQDATVAVTEIEFFARQ